MHFVVVFVVVVVVACLLVSVKWHVPGIEYEQECTLNLTYIKQTFFGASSVHCPVFRWAKHEFEIMTSAVACKL